MTGEARERSIDEVLRLGGMVVRFLCVRVCGGLGDCSNGSPAVTWR